MLRRVSSMLALAVLCGSSAVASAAGVTPVTAVSGSYDGANHTLDYLLGASYGYGVVSGTGSLSSTISWSSGINSITFTRVYDTGGAGNPLFLNGSNAATADDSVWRDGQPTFQVQVRYAGYGQTLGWYDNTTNTAQDILSLTGSGLNPSFTYALGSPPAALSPDFLWYDKTSGNGILYSDSTKNADGDHMITFRVTGSDASGNLINGGLGAYVICFEDLPVQHSDHDYNDMVVQVSQIGLGGGPPVVPLPAAAWSGLATLGALGAWGAAKRRAKH